MIRIRYTKSPAACFNYFIADMRLSPAERSGIWMGRACDSLGVVDSGRVSGLHLALALDGYDVGGRRFVRQMPPPEKRRAAYDMVIAPAKSISLAALGGGPGLSEAVRWAFAGATDTAFNVVEQLSMKQGRAAKRVPSGALCAAAFTHERSRYGDPHLHRHFLTINVTRVPGGGLWALTLELAMRALGYVERLFQADLFRRLLQKGVPARLENSVAQIPLSRDFCDRFSQGHANIVGVIDKIERGGEFIARRRRRPLANIVNDRVRPKKASGILDWRGRMTKSDLSEMRSLKIERRATLEDVGDKELVTRVGERLRGNLVRDHVVACRAAAAVAQEDPRVDPVKAALVAKRLVLPAPVLAKAESAVVSAPILRARQSLKRLARASRGPRSS